MLLLTPGGKSPSVSLQFYILVLLERSVCFIAVLEDELLSVGHFIQKGKKEEKKKTWQRSVSFGGGIPASQWHPPNGFFFFWKKRGGILFVHVVIYCSMTVLYAPTAFGFFNKLFFVIQFYSSRLICSVRSNCCSRCCSKRWQPYIFKNTIIIWITIRNVFHVSHPKAVLVQPDKVAKLQAGD